MVVFCFILDLCNQRKVRVGRTLSNMVIEVFRYMQAEMFYLLGEQQFGMYINIFCTHIPVRTSTNLIKFDHDLKMNMTRTQLDKKTRMTNKTKWLSKSGPELGLVPACFCKFSYILI